MVQARGVSLQAQLLSDPGNGRADGESGSLPDPILCPNLTVGKEGRRESPAAGADLWNTLSVGRADSETGLCDQPEGPSLTKSAEVQLGQLEPEEREQLEMVLRALRSAEDVQRYGWPVSDSPAGEVWRVRAGRVGLFVAIDEDSLLVVGLAVRRPGSGEFYGGWD